MTQSILQNILPIVFLMLFGAAISLHDIRHKIISPVLAWIYGGLGTAYLIVFRWNLYTGIEIAVVTAVLILYYLLLRKRIGQGDLKYLWILGLWFSIDIWFFGLLYTGILSLAYWAGFALMQNARKTGERAQPVTIPFAPFITLGFLLASLLDKLAA